MVRIYQNAFAEPPWNENWASDEVLKDMKYALSQKNPIMLVAAENGPVGDDSRIVGFTWGYSIVPAKFPFLADFVDISTCGYIDEVAVDAGYRKIGVATLLTKQCISRAAEMGMSRLFLRTDESNTAAMNLYASLGFEKVLTGKTLTPIYDPVYKNRIYLNFMIGRGNVV